MRILFVTPYVPSRIRVRSFNLIKSLAQVHDIFLVSLQVEGYEQAMVEDIARYCAVVELVPLPKWQAYANCVFALPTDMPLRIAYYRSQAFVQRLQECIQRYDIDIIHGELIKVVPALKRVQEATSIPVLYDAVDCISWFLQQKLNTTYNPLKKMLVYSELLKMRRFERRELTDFAQVIITAEDDRERLGQLTGQAQAIQVVRNCVDTEYFTPFPEERETNTLVFCAKLDYFPNAQAICYFCSTILPLIWRQRPEVQLNIVGNNPPGAVRALGADPRITVTGYVPDIRYYLSSATVAIAPLLIAAGTQFKVLEALAMATPLVTTSRCCQALGMQHGVHLLVADDPESYAHAILQLLRDPQYAQRLGATGRTFVMEHYSWTSAAATVHTLYEAIATRTKQGVQMEALVAETQHHYA